MVLRAESVRSCCECMHYYKDLYHATQMEGSHSGAALPYCIQPVLALVKMEGHSMKQPVHVTVPMVSVGTTVEVSTVTHVTLILVDYTFIAYKLFLNQMCF